MVEKLITLLEERIDENEEQAFKRNGTPQRLIYIGAKYEDEAILKWIKENKQ